MQNKRSQTWRILLTLTALLAWAGCETNQDVDSSVQEPAMESGSGVLTLRPPSASIDIGQGQPASVTFEVSGGQAPYQWHLANEDMGVLEARGHRAVYTAGGAAGGNYLVATDSQGHSAGAQILSGAIAIVPNAVTLATNQLTQAFSVTGGHPSYRWSITDEGLGTLETSGPNAVYHRHAERDGTLFIKVTDGNGFHAHATIEQL